MKNVRTIFAWLTLTIAFSIPVVSFAQSCSERMIAGNAYGHMECVLTGEDADYCYYSCDMSACGSLSNCNRLFEVLELEPIIN